MPGETGSGALWVIDRGRGPAVALIHGQPGQGADWGVVADRLAERCRVIVPDRPGYGRSPGPASGFAANAQVLAAALTERQATPTVVVGHSYGGGVAIALAAARPELVAGLVLVASVGSAGSLGALDRLLARPVVGDLAMAAGTQAIGRVLPVVRSGLTRSRRRAASWLAANMPDASFVQSAAGRGRRVWRSAAQEQRAMVVELASIEAAFPTITVPSTVVVGAWDAVVPPGVGARIAAAIHGSELEVVGTAGHFLPRDASDVVVRAVLRRAGLAA